MKLEDGVLIVLPRDEAKVLFGHREDAARLEFIHELLDNEAIPKLNCGGKWRAMHEALETVQLENSLLGQAILGGRPLHQGDDYHACLVRPDIVGFICEQTNQIDAAEIDGLSSEILAVVEIYRKAAEIRGAMVFAAKR